MPIQCFQFLTFLRVAVSIKCCKWNKCKEMLHCVFTCQLCYYSIYLVYKWTKMRSEMQQKFISIIFQTKDNFVIWGEIRTAAAGLVRSATGVKYLQVITLFTGFQHGKLRKTKEYFGKFSVVWKRILGKI